MDKLGKIILSERSYTQKATHSIFPLYEMSRERWSHRDSKEISGFLGLGEAATMTANGHGASLWADENILKLDSGDDSEYTEKIKPHWIVYLTWVNFILYELDLNKAVIIKRK